MFEFVCLVVVVSLTPDQHCLSCAGRELWHNGRSVTVDYDTLDPLVRRDSYQDTSCLETGEVYFNIS